MVAAGLAPTGRRHYGVADLELLRIRRRRAERRQVVEVRLEHGPRVAGHLEDGDQVSRGVVTATAKERDYLESAVENRDVIGQAKGILMARNGISEDDAFDILRRASQRLNLKLREIAEGVAHPTQDPPEPPSA